MTQLTILMSPSAYWTRTVVLKSRLLFTKVTHLRLMKSQFSLDKLGYFIKSLSKDLFS